VVSSAKIEGSQILKYKPRNAWVTGRVRHARLTSKSKRAALDRSTTSTLREESAQKA